MIINLLDNTLNQPSKFRTKSWIEINDVEMMCMTKKSKVEDYSAKCKFV